MDIKKLLTVLKLDKNKPNWNYVILILILVLTYIVIDNVGNESNTPAAFLNCFSVIELFKSLLTSTEAIFSLSK